MIRAKHLILLVFALFSYPALAQNCSPEALGLSSRDYSRLHSIENSRLKGLGEAMLSPSLAERDILAKLFSQGIGDPKVVPTGDYQCRTIKLGGLGPLTSYKYFDCRISNDGEQLFIEKLTGSQRFTGTLFYTEDGVSYRGASHYGYEEPREYAGDTDRDQVGCVFEVLGDPTSLILELPQPHFESTHDIIQLRLKR